MGNFSRGGGRSSGGFSGGRSGGFGGGRSSGGGFGGRPTMHKATCSKCGNDCELPFRPSGDRPVFCSNCFDKQGGGASDRPSRFGGDRRERPSFGADREMNDAVCDKCGKDCQVPFKPTSGKPVFCSDCFKTEDRGDSRGGSRRDSTGGGSSEVTEQLKQLNAKIDKLVNALLPKEKTEAKPAKVEHVTVKELSVKKSKVEKKPKTKAKAVVKKAPAKNPSSKLRTGKK